MYTWTKKVDHQAERMMMMERREEGWDKASCQTFAEL